MYKINKYTVTDQHKFIYQFYARNANNQHSIDISHYYVKNEKEKWYKLFAYEFDKFISIILKILMSFFAGYSCLIVLYEIIRRFIYQKFLDNLVMIFCYLMIILAVIHIIVLSLYVLKFIIECFENLYSYFKDEVTILISFDRKKIQSIRNV